MTEPEYEYVMKLDAKTYHVYSEGELVRGRYWVRTRCGLKIVGLRFKRRISVPNTARPCKRCFRKGR